MPRQSSLENWEFDLSSLHRKSIVQPGPLSPSPLPVFFLEVGNTKKRYILLQLMYNSAHFLCDGTILCRNADLFISARYRYDHSCSRLKNGLMNPPRKRIKRQRPLA